MLHGTISKTSYLDDGASIIDDIIVLTIGVCETKQTFAFPQLRSL